MPELPEVETIKQELNQLIVNKKIKSVEINLAKQVKTPLARFLKLVQGAKVVGVNRRAKMLILGLDNDYSLVFHLKMTGQLIYRGQSGKLSGGGHPIKHNLKNLPNEYSKFSPNRMVHKDYILRWRTVSPRQTPLATEILRLSTVPAIGMRTS